MKCPVDNQPMLVIEYEGIEIDYCAACGGIWLDEGELELLVGAEETDAIALSGGVPAPAPGEKARRCPACRKKMRKEATAGPDSVTYDRCPRGHGLWFDQGELGRVVESGAAPGAGGRVAAFFRELFPADGAATREEGPS
ncbi:MAG: zf-TFIIB domain-containing protein [Candidatus Hydrogenedentes bacterium]|nr:zf-TFIIB domain-containing protein [Candidatus Hydrogenedentota bacterium]